MNLLGATCDHTKPMDEQCGGIPELDCDCVSNTCVEVRSEENILHCASLQRAWANIVEDSRLPAVINPFTLTATQSVIFVQLRCCVECYLRDLKVYAWHGGYQIDCQTLSVSAINECNALSADVLQVTNCFPLAVAPIPTIGLTEMPVAAATSTKTIILGFVIGGIIAIGIIVWLCCARRNKAKQSDAEMARLVRQERAATSGLRVPQDADV